MLLFKQKPVNGLVLLVRNKHIQVQIQVKIDAIDINALFFFSFEKKPANLDCYKRQK